MFKTELSLKSSKATRALRKSDRRKLIESIATSLRNNAALVAAALADADVELRPVAECTLVAAVRGDAYFVDLDNGTFMPTLVTALLATTPLALPVFETHAVVFLQFLSQGADFMLPGCRHVDRIESMEPAWSRGDVVVIAVAGTPVALGTALMSRAEAAAAGRKGKLVRVLHYYGDALWLASSKRGNDAVVAALTDNNDDNNKDNNDETSVGAATTSESTSAAAAAAAAAVAVVSASADEVLEQAFLRGCWAVPRCRTANAGLGVFRANACASTCRLDSRSQSIKAQEVASVFAGDVDEWRHQARRAVGRRLACDLDRS
jgi:predicted RNA-binding protein (TIGR00451 family)